MELEGHGGRSGADPGRVRKTDGADLRSSPMQETREPTPFSVLILAATEAEAAAETAWLREDGIHTYSCPDVESLVEAIREGVGIGVLSEEAIRDADLGPLSDWLAGQPTWSDFPFVVLTERSGDLDEDAGSLRRMLDLGNVTFLKRPFPPMTFASIVRTALASRRRQYEARDQLDRISAAEDRLSFALQAGQLGAWELRLPGWDLNASEIFKLNFGRDPKAALGYGDLLATLHPDDRKQVQDGIDDSISRRGDFDIECRVLTSDDDSRWVEMRGRARYDEAGEPLALAGVTLDITGRKLAEERQRLLIRELHHRVKNTLATVQAIVGSTARSARSIEEFYESFGARIASLAHTHDLLTEEFWQMASLRELLTKELAHYEDPGSDRVRLNGPPVQLYSDIAVPIGMALHELTTNAAKYGALSVPDGRLDVSWELSAKNGRNVVAFDWRERDGPVVQDPKQRGFGTRLLHRVLTAQVKAEVELEFEPRGLHFRMEFPLLPSRPAF